ncbi:coagulation factor XII [Rhineura floridana]|uniref:coagulation factor XII n=1 Tax=Rhineura floridana TaxID=261503 RepID=UPI002AC873B1|nr:coagulation factor XII [Rhineura floridana]
MTSLLLLLLFVVLNPAEPLPDHHRRAPKTKHKEMPSNDEPCHFPFRYQRKMYHSCIQSSILLNPQPWCATTENYDRNGKWRYCGKEERPRGHCDRNPCQNGGVCEARRTGFHCICTTGFHGKHCEKEHCFGTQTLLHIGRKDTWLWHRPTGLEECHCAGKKFVCKPVHGKACAINPCLNGGHCVEMKHNWACGCPEGFSGPLCDIEHTQTCYNENGHQYRGMAYHGSSGAPCLPWDSPLLLDEYSFSLDNAVSLGLGAHAFCRNPDKDGKPWCYVLREMQLSWEFCNITQCHPQSTDTVVTQNEPEQKPPNETSSSSSARPNQPMLGSAPVCGQRYTKTTSSRKRIVGGMVALHGSHPYMAAIYMGDQFCGGSLIASCWILTAAHCLEFRPDVSKISVVLGQTLYNKSTDGSMKFQVQDYLLHENYSAITKRHDIALVRLKEKAPGHCAVFSHSIWPVCLPSSMEAFDTSKMCQIAGWGHMYEGADKLSLYLQEADMPIIPYEQCCSPEVHGTRITQDMLCAGYLDGRADACQGDSGGPLVCEEQGVATLRGIISWGTGCALVNKPGVYTSVSNYLNWIQSNMH